MNLTLLDRGQLEALMLDPPRTESEPLRCSDNAALDLLPQDQAERSTRIRHVLAAAHELLTRVANASFVGRSLVGEPTRLKQYMKIHFAGAEREGFVVVFLDSQMRVIAAEQMFVGTLTQVSVHPREVVKRALELNAAHCVVAHNHSSSGNTEPSRADRCLTAQLKSALAMVDVNLVDHIVVAGGECLSFVESGRL